MQLRKMTMSDADFMLQLKNYPETRKFSLVTPFEIKKEDHYAYLENNLQHFQVIEDNAGEPVGVLRIRDNEVSIWIDKQCWSRGVATYILQHQCDRNMFAKIVEGNIASMRCFIRAGFLPKSFQDNYYIFQR